MERTRLTDKKAGEVNDVYTMNGARPDEAKRGGNGSGETFQKEYQTGDTSSWKEDPISTQETAKLNTEDAKRNEMNLGEIRMAFAQAIKQSSQMREHAAKCMIASERMLPGASQEALIANSSDLMFLPDSAIDGVLSRQASLALSVTSAADEPEAPEAPKAAGEGEPDGDEAPKAPETEEAPEAKEAEDKMAALEDKLAKLTDVVMAMAQAATEPAPAPEPDGDEPAPEPEPEIEMGKENIVEASAKTASSHGDDALESIFSAVEPAAASLTSSMVKKASAGSSDDILDSLWGSTPNVSAVFS